MFSATAVRGSGKKPGAMSCRGIIDDVDKVARETKANKERDNIVTIYSRNRWEWT